MLVRAHTHITEHLHGFGILDLNMVLFDHGFHKILMNQFPEVSPLLPILHNQEMVTRCHEIVGDI